MKPALEWIKSNIFIVVFGVVMIGGLVAIPMVAGSMNEGIRSEVKSRAGRLSKLQGFEKTSVEIGSALRGTQVTDEIVVNPAFIQRFEALTTAELADAENILAAAERHNRKDRGVLLPELFPDPPLAQREVLPKTFHDALIAAHDALLEEVRAGSPPDVAEMSQSLEASRSRFLSTQLQKGRDEALTEKEQEQLDEAMANARLARYRDRAESISFYASAGALGLPVWDQSRLPTMGELFDWQWQYWINQDLLRALAAANASSSSVRRAPVKRVLSLQPMYGLPESAGAAAPANPAVEVKPDYGVSFTGRTTNPLYDVRQVQLVIVAEATRLPQVIDAIAQQNFYTIVDMDIEEASLFDAAQNGFLYGSDPVVQATIELESVWLRSWTSGFMPASVRTALGVPDPKPAAPAPPGDSG